LTEAPVKKSDLGARVMSAIVMLAIAGGALWAGGWIFALFVFLVACGLFWEWLRLSQRLVKTSGGLVIWSLAGLIYTILVAYCLIQLRNIGVLAALIPLLVVIATDVGAYFSGRAIGGPKIAPGISPSKTWAGLAGGAILAVIVTSLVPLIIGGSDVVSHDQYFIVLAPLFVIALAILAQAGDFFESWMKRRAGMKDSSTLIPGHGGIFDRIDGLMPVTIAFYLFFPSLGVVANG